MLTRFSGGLTLHTHFRMDGEWKVTAPGKSLPRAFDDEIRLRLVTDGPMAYALRMPVLELLPTAEESRVIGHLGPDRAADQTRSAAGREPRVLRLAHPAAVGLPRLLAWTMSRA